MKIASKEGARRKDERGGRIAARPERGSIAVEQLPFRSIGELEPLWRDLETRAHPSFFLSWSWIGTWLETSRAAPTIVAARLQGRLIGLALLIEARRRRAGLFWPTLSLNETGDPLLDCIMIEDNGFLAERGLEDEVVAACLRHIHDDMRAWRELKLGGVTERVAQQARALALSTRVRAEQPSFHVDIGMTGAEGESQRFSRNSRQQINRSLALYRKRGPLSLAPSADLDDALSRFAEMEALHQRRWTAKGKAGAFAEPYFGRFHRALLARCFPQGEADVLRIKAGEQTIGLLYCFFYGGEAYAYQNGFLYEQDARLKPGLVSHVMALGFCRGRNLTRYRLLAGDSRYKRSLATGSDPLYWMTLRRDHWTVRFESLLRRLAGRDA